MDGSQLMGWVAEGTPRPIVCGHRGAPAVVAENTIASFRAAADRGASWVEFDVRPTADAKLIIHHDPATSAGQHIATTNADQLGSSIPLFGELAQELPTLGLDIEMKTDDIPLSLGDFAALVIDEIDTNCHPGTELIITSFDADALVEVRNRRPDLPTGLLYFKGTDDAAIARAVADGHVAIAPWIDLLSAETVAKARAASLAIATWTVNKPEQVRHAVSLGVDMIIGDDPTIIVEHL